MTAHPRISISEKSRTILGDVELRELKEACVAALFPAAGIMVGLGFLTGQDVSLVLACLGFYGITSTYRSGSLPNQIEIAPK